MVAATDYYYKMASLPDSLLDNQIIITNGKKLWIYKPDDNQVMLGRAPAFFNPSNSYKKIATIIITIKCKKTYICTRKNQKDFYKTKNGEVAQLVRAQDS